LLLKIASENNMKEERSKETIMLGDDSLGMMTMMEGRN